MPTDQTSTTHRPLAPGARVEVRGEEWIVRSVETASHGGQAVHVLGTSELVRGKDAIFLTELDAVNELRPEETKLVEDPSPRYRRSRLYIESLLRRTPPTEPALYIGHRAAMRRADYQLQPAAKALRQLRPRILMADGVGLGKTIEVGVLLSELIRRGRGDRILVVALKSILAQFQEELWARFTIPLVRLDSVGIQRVQSKIPTSQNPFYFFDKVIISIDTLKKDEKYRRYLEDSQWDVVVVDECQHVAIRGGTGSSQQSQRARLARLLARTSDALVLTSATPHDGRPESFASLMNLLEPTAIADPENYTKDEVEDLFLRRFKKDVAHDVDESFQERKLRLEHLEASPQENEVFSELSEITFRTIGRSRNGKGVLFRTLLLKSFLSSPAACIETIDARLRHARLQRPDEGTNEDEAPPPEVDDAAHDRDALQRLRGLVDAVKPAAFTKYQKLLAELDAIGLGKRGSDERIVIFSERIPTLRFLETRLRKDLQLKADQIQIFHGTVDDQKQQELVKSFGTESSPLRILLASDAASEGINLHYFCHRMVHFDLPWSLITLEQRNGRIDRFGQTAPPELVYLLTVPGDDSLKGDLRVLDRLIEKEQNAHENLGDAAWLLDLHDVEREEEHVGKGIEESRPAEEVIPDAEDGATGLGFLELLHAEGEPMAETVDPIRLFEDDLAYAREAFREILGDSEQQHVEWHDHLDGFTLHAPEDLVRRFDYLPPELRRDGDSLQLTTDRQRVMDALAESRQDESKWPDWHLFWPLHPVTDWIGDRVLAAFHRHEAPILRAPGGVSPEEVAFVFQGVVSNNESRPIVVDWFATKFDRSTGRFTGLDSLESLVEAAGLNHDSTNPGSATAIDELIERLESLLPDAVTQAREHMLALRKTRAATIGAPLREGLTKVKEWRDRSIRRLDDELGKLERLSGGVHSARKRRIEEERREVEARYRRRQVWINEGMRTIDEPYLRLAAAIVLR